MQYLVSVIDDKSNPGSTDRRPAISAFNERLIAGSYWVFAGGLALARHGYGHRQPGRAGGVQRRAFRGVEGVPRRRLGVGGPRSGCGTQARRRGVEGLRSEDRGAAVPVSDVEEAVTRAHHEEWARVVAALTRRFGDLDIAEEAAAEAFATAVERWPADGVPPNPGAWLTTTANRKAIDRIRRENKRDDKQKEAQMAYDDDPPEPPGAIEDERLRLIFTCCHPALALETRVALTLRMVGRSDRARDRACLPGAGEHHGAADHPREGQDQGGSHPLPGAVRGGSPGPRLRRARRPVPRLQRGLPGDRPRHRSRASRPDRRGDPAHPPGPGPHAGGRRGGRAAGADAPHRGPPRRPGLGQRRAGGPRRAGPRGLGRGARRRGSPAGARAPGRRGWLRADTRSSPRSTPCTPPPATSATPTGRRSSPSTTSSSASTPRRSSPSTGPSRSPSLTARRWRWRPSTASRAIWPAITPTTRPAPTCCAGWAAARRSRAAYDRAIELAGNTAETAYLTRRRDQLG